MVLIFFVFSAWIINDYLMYSLCTFDDMFFGFNTTRKAVWLTRKKEASFSNHAWKLKIHRQRFHRKEQGEDSGTSAITQHRHTPFHYPSHHHTPFHYPSHHHTPFHYPWHHHTLLLVETLQRWDKGSLM